MEPENEMQDVEKELRELREQVRAVEYKVNQMTEGYSRPIFQTEHPHIIRVEGVHGGRPIVRDAGVSVQTIVALFKQNLSPEQIAEDYDQHLSLAQIYDALGYYYDHPGEIDQYLEENRVALEQGWKPPISS